MPPPVQPPQAFSQESLDALFADGGNNAQAVAAAAAPAKVETSHPTVEAAAPPATARFRLAPLALGLIVGLVLGAAATFSLAPANAKHPAASSETSPKRAAHRQESLPPQQFLFVGDPVQVTTSYSQLQGCGIRLLECTGYRDTEEGRNPVVTLVATDASAGDKLVCSKSASVAQFQVNNLLKQGYRVKFNLVGLPAFDRTGTRAMGEWYLFALHKDPEAGSEAKMVLLETTPKTTALLNEMIRDDWQIQSATGRPLWLQTNNPSTVSVVAALFMDKPRR